mmetsp:Transcript_33530/g.111905  ORF Transcript_33530/g.111905 Transcript_33530/m.111905 type:complete len:203 (-) Transcript_33530:737-1345(-)
MRAFSSSFRCASPSRCGGAGCFDGCLAIGGVFGASEQAAPRFGVEGRSGSPAAAHTVAPVGFGHTVASEGAVPRGWLEAAKGDAVCLRLPLVLSHHEKALAHPGARTPACPCEGPCRGAGAASLDCAAGGAPPPSGRGGAVRPYLNDSPHSAATPWADLSRERASQRLSASSSASLLRTLSTSSSCCARTSDSMSGSTAHRT